MNQTISEQLALERLARKHEQLRDAVIGAAVFVAFVGALATMPWWLA